ncbi:MAG: ATP-binding protein [Bdellovibrionota bacterium]
MLLAEFWERIPSELVFRNIRVPAIQGKIDVFVGMRRTGKTYLTYQRILDLLKQGVSRTAVLYMNFEDDRLLPLDRAGLAALLEAFYRLHPENHDRICHFFLDEIQNVDGWPAVIRRFLDTRKVQITLTGSSGKLLSHEIATALRGRSIATEVWPMCIEEYLRMTSQNTARPASASPRAQDRWLAVLSGYIKTGGLPEVIRLGELDRRRVLQDYVSVVILKDIVERYRVKNEPLLRYFVKTLISQISKPLSLNKIGNALRSQGRKTGKNTLYQYLNYVRDCYLAFDVPIFSESARKRQSNPRKIYAIDTGLVCAQSIGASENLGRLFENLVFLDLRPCPRIS